MKKPRNELTGAEMEAIRKHQTRVKREERSKFRAIMEKSICLKIDIPMFIAKTERFTDETAKMLGEQLAGENGPKVMNLLAHRLKQASCGASAQVGADCITQFLMERSSAPEAHRVCAENA